MAHEPTDRYQLFGYKVDVILGRGGSGTVYRGIHPETGQPAALKLFRHDFFSGKGHVRELGKSIQRFKKLSHQNVVQMYDFLSDENVGHAVVMEYVDGPDLRWYLENRPYNLNERCVIAAQICNGLQYLHDQGITHHDLKPANVLFTKQGVAKLTDYSLSYQRFFGLLGGGITDQVTPMYVAPELIRKKKATPLTDIYSLGMTFYLMFTEHFPWEVDDIRKLYQHHLKSSAPHPSQVSRKCPQPLGDLIMHMIAKEPKDRPESCDQLRIRISEIGRSRI